MAEVLQFAQGQTATLTAQFVTSPAGMPIDVPDATIEVIGPGATSVLPATAMTGVSGLTGFYYYDWVIPNSLDVNTYTVLVSGTVLGVPTAMTTYLQVLQAGTPTPVSSSQRVIELLAAFDSYIGCAQRIPVKNELAMRSATRDQFQLTFPRWNLGNHAIYLNKQKITTGYTINYDTGTITFPKPMLESDSVMAHYNFRWFTQVDLLRFLSDALSQINLEPPGTVFSLESIPDPHVGVLMMGATKNAIKHLLFCLAFQEPSKVFGSPDELNRALETFKYIKENNEKEFTEEKKNLKRARYPSTMAIVAPEHTLPGGRARWFRYLFSGSS